MEGCCLTVMEVDLKDTHQTLYLSSVYIWQHRSIDKYIKIGLLLIFYKIYENGEMFPS